jgi:hypothetical protein
LSYNCLKKKERNINTILRGFTLRVCFGQWCSLWSEDFKFFVSHVEEYMAGHVGVMKFIQKGSWWEQTEATSREGLSLFQVLLKLMLTYGKGRTW